MRVYAIDIYSLIKKSANRIGITGGSGSVQ